MNTNTACQRTTLLLNWYANPYHTPIFVAKQLGFYEELGIRLAILEPSDPSDVTDLVGRARVDIGLKAMVHCYAARARNYPIQSIGTLLDEPPTGLIFLRSSGIQSFADLRGKRIGFIGEFGKIMIDDLAKRAGIPQDQYKTIRVGMNITDAILRGVVDAGIGIGCFQKVELAEMANEAVDMLRIDELAALGCCCFCSILFITHETMQKNEPEKLKRFMQATQRGLAYTLENLEAALDILFQQQPRLRNKVYEKIFTGCLPYFSRDLRNVERDWEKVGCYAKHLGIIPQEAQTTDFYTDRFLPSAPYAHSAPLGIIKNKPESEIATAV